MSEFLLNIKIDPKVVFIILTFLNRKHVLDFRKNLNKLFSYNLIFIPLIM